MNTTRSQLGTRLAKPLLAAALAFLPAATAAAQDSLPRDMTALAGKLNDPQGLGGRVAEALRTGGADAALKLLRQELGQDFKRLGNLYQRGGGDHADSLTVVDALLDSIELGEMQQGTASDDTGWRAGTRRLTLKAKGATSYLTQTRPTGGASAQKSTYTWSHPGGLFGIGSCSGSGTDWLLAIRNNTGVVVGYAIYSESKSTRSCTDADQREAVELWKRLSERAEAAKRKKAAQEAAERAAKKPKAPREAADQASFEKQHAEFAAKHKRMAPTSTATTQDDALDALPRDMTALAGKLNDPQGLGGRVAEALRTGGADAALKLLRQELGQDFKRLGNLYQRGGGDHADSLTVVDALLDSIELGEMQQGTVEDDTGWLGSKRTLTLKIKGATSYLTQTRPTGGASAQKSTCTWSHPGGLSGTEGSGSGTDWLLAIRNSTGAVVAHAIYSESKSTRSCTDADQRETVDQWRRLSEGAENTKRPAR